MDERDTITLQIDRDVAPDIVEVLRKKREDLDMEIAAKDAELKELISRATRLGFTLETLLRGGTAIQISDADQPVVGRLARATKLTNGYKVSFTVWDKVQYILRKEIAPLTKREIIDRIEAFEPKLVELPPKKRRQFSVSVSNILTTKYKKGFLTREEPEGQEFKYELQKIVS